MKAQVERHRLRGFFRVAYVFAAPAVLLCGIYLSTYLGLNSRQGSTALAELISAVVPGEVDFEFISIAPDLLTAQLYETTLRDLRGNEVVEVRFVECAFSLGAFFRNRIQVSDCAAHDGQLLVEIYDEGGVGLMQATEGRFRGKQNPVAPPIFHLFDAEFSNFDVLVSARDMMLRFDGVDMSLEHMEAGRGHLELNATATAGSGRFLFTERAFGLGDGRGSWELVEWDAMRRTRPWAAARGDLPLPEDGESGVLDVPLERVDIDSLRWRGEDMRVRRLLFAGDEFSFDGSGLVRLVPERPKLARAERAFLTYEGVASVELPPDSVVLDWVLPGVFGQPSEGEGSIEPLEFSGFGTVRFFEGETRLVMRDVALLDWHLTRLDAGLGWHQGVMSLSPDSEAEIFGGTVTGEGEMTTIDGLWDLRLCFDGIRLDELGAPWGVEGPWSRVALTTSPARCEPDGERPVQLNGDLTLKALEVAPARTTPDDKEIQAPMIAGIVDDATLRWDELPPGLAHQSLRFSLEGSLSQRGILSIGTPSDHGLTVRTRSDVFSVGGDVDVVDEQLLAVGIDVRSSAVGPWITAFGGAGPAGLRGQASAMLDGAWDDPDVSGLTVTAAMDEPSRGIPAFSLDAPLSVLGRTLVVDDARVSTEFGRATVSGSAGIFGESLWDLNSDPRLDVAVSLSEVDLGALSPSAGIDAEFDASFRVTGRAGAPTVSGSFLELVDFRAFGEPIDYLLVDSYTLSDSVIRAESVLLVKGKGTLGGDVSVDLAERTLEVTAHGRGFRLGELRGVAEAGVSAAGDVDFDLRATGSFDEPSISGRATFEGFRVQGLDIGQLSLTAYTFDGAVEVAGQAAGDFDIEGRIPVDGTPWDFDVRFRDAAVDQHFAQLEGVFERLRLTGMLAVTVDPVGTGSGSAILTLDALDLRVSKRQFDIPTPARITWTGTREESVYAHELEITQATMRTPGGVLDASGGMSFDEEGSALDFRVVGESDFSLLRFFPELVVDSEGLASVDVSVRGPLDDPELSGEVAFESARIAPRGLGMSVAFGPGRLVIRDGAIRTTEDEPLVGSVYGGSFTAWGDIGLSGLSPSSIDYHLFVTNLAYRIPDVANVTLTSENLRFQAPSLTTYDDWLVTGDVEVVDARYYQDIEFVGEALSFGGFGRTVDRFSLPVWLRIPAIGRLQTDLRITGRDRFMVENTIATADMDLEFRTDLELTGRLEAMHLVGEMEALEGGTVTYRGRSFEVQRATLAFRGVRDEFGYPMPSLDSELTATIRPCQRAVDDSSFDISSGSTLDEDNDVFLTAEVRGQLPLDLSFQLQSTPFYDQRDQLSLILTGCTVDELTASEAGGRTLEVVLAPVIDVVERNVEERLDLDEVDLIPTTQGSAGITIEDEVSERFTWGLDATVGSESTNNRQVIRGEYRLFDWLLVEVQEETSRDETITVDAGFRFRLRLN